MRRTIGVGLACAVLLTSGCAAVEDTFAPRPTATPTPAAASPATAGGTITPAEARRVAAAYAQTFNRAAAKLDGAGLGAIETEPLLSGHQADFAVRRKLGQPVAGVRALGDVAVPRDGVDPTWFVAPMAMTRPAGARRRVVFAWDGSGSWKAVSDTAADPRTTRALRGSLEPRTPGVAVPGGARNLALAPGLVPRAHAAADTPGRAARQQALFTPSQAITTRRAALLHLHGFFRRSGWAGRIKVAPAGGTVRALRTTNGGALVWYTLDTTYGYRRGPGGERLPWAGGWAALSGKPYATTELTRVERTQYTAYVPPRGKGRVTIVGFRNAPLSATST